MISPTLSNELRVNWSRNVGTNFQTLDTFGGAVIPPAATLHPGFAPSENAYQISLTGANALFADGLNAANIQRQVNIVDAVLLTKGSHQLKLGVDYRRLFPVYVPLQYVQAYTFNGAAGALAGSASSLFVSALSTRNGSPHVTNLSAYAQDKWTMSSRLTLTYGVRWDVNPPPGLRGTTDALTLTTANPAAIALAPPGTPMYSTTFNNVAPRIGGSYRLRDFAGRETILRGGWGVVFDLGNNTVMDNFTFSFPFNAQRFLSNVPFPVAPALLAPPTIEPGAPVSFLVAVDPNLKLPYTDQWNVAIEQALGATST